MANEEREMSEKWLCIFWATSLVLARGELSPGIMKNPSFPRPFDKHYSRTHLPRTQWAHRPQESYYRHESEGVSHGYTSSPLGSTLKATESSSEQSGYSAASLQEYWRSPSANSNFTGANYYGYLRPFLGLSGSVEGSHKDSIQGSPSIYQYQQMRLTTPNNATFKKRPAYYLKGKLQVPSHDALGKPKFKKTVSYQILSNYKNGVYPRVHKPYVKHKYPTQKTVHPLYRRYYQSPYQRYAIPSTEMLHYKSKPQSDGYYKAFTASPTPLAEKYYTTQRMDDVYSDGSAISEDYSTYNDTHHKISDNYYETYEEVEKTTSEPEESSYDETTTRGYYGDRIYMSTQVAPITSDKTSLKNKYFIVRRTSHDDDIETIFE